MAIERDQLSRERVVQAAIEIIDAGGLGACTMRSLADRLGVKAMALYWHVANKDDLLDAVIDNVLQGVDVPRTGPGGWPDQVKGFAVAFRRLVLEHPRVIPLLAQRPATGYLSAKRVAGRWLGDLEDAGFAERDAVDVIRMVVRFVLGSCVADTAPAGDPPSRAVHNPSEIDGLLRTVTSDDRERLFLLSLDALVAGIEATVPHATMSATTA